MIEKGIILKWWQVQSILKGQMTRIIDLDNKLSNRVDVTYIKGMILWAREPWAEKDGKIFYMPSNGVNGKFKSTIRMPKEAARLRLNVTNVQIGLLSDISKEELKLNELHHYQPCEFDKVFIVDFKIISVLGRIGKSYKPSISQRSLSTLKQTYSHA